MKHQLKLIFASIGFLLTACSHPLEIVGEGDIIDTQGIYGCTLEQFNTPTTDGKHPCPNLVVGAYQVDYLPVARPGWRFVGWENYCQTNTYACHFDVNAPAVQTFWGKTVLPLVAHFEPVTEPGELLKQVLGVGASAAIYRQSDHSFLLTTTASNNASSGALMRVDANTGQARTLAPLPYLGWILELSRDQKTLYISYANKNIIDIFDLTSNKFVASINPGKSADGLHVLFANSISASPTDPGVVAVALGRGNFPNFLSDNYRIALFKNGVPFGNSITSSDVPLSVEFSPDGTLLWGDYLTSIAVGPNGLRNLVRRYGVYLATPQFVGDMVFSGDWALDPATLGRLGRYAVPDNEYLGYVRSAAYAPDLDFVFRYVPTFDRLLVNDARRFTPVASYALAMTGNFRGMQASSTGLLLITDSSVYLLAEDDIEPMSAQGCTTRNLTAEIGKPYLRLDCPFSEVIHSPASGKLYASVAGILGSNGNSIAVIDAHTGLVDEFIPAVSEPHHLALNADGSKLFVSSAVTDFVHRIDLATGAIDGKFWLNAETTGDSSVILDLLAHPLDPSTFVVVQGWGGRDESLISVSDMSRTGLLHYSSSYGHAKFAADGKLVVSREVSFNRMLEELEVSPAGFSSTSIATSGWDNHDYLTFDLHDNAIIRLDGAVFDRATLALQPPLQIPDESFEWYIRTAVDPVSGAFYHGARRYSQYQYMKLLRFDIESRELTGALEFDATGFGFVDYLLQSILPLGDGHVVVHADDDELATTNSYIYILKDSDFSQ